MWNYIFDPQVTYFILSFKSEVHEIFDDKNWFWTNPWYTILNPDLLLKIQNSNTRSII